MIEVKRVTLADVYKRLEDKAGERLTEMLKDGKLKFDPNDTSLLQAMRDYIVHQGEINNAEKG